ncbi:MAG: porphobilinogen synthase [Bacteriovoracaceae bacterium]
MSKNSEEINFSLNQRPRRNRKSASVRSFVQENQLTKNDLIMPLFVQDQSSDNIEVVSMPGQFRYSPDGLLKEVESLLEAGIHGICLFPACKDETKDKLATQGHNPDHFYQRSLKDIKARFPEMTVMTDVAMDPYSCDGHDGYVDEKTGEILNDPTLEILGKMALEQARSGADIIGPSDMMDGRVGFIRDVLDQNGFENVSIMSYCAKYASSFYGPFRDALDSAPKVGDKKTYQLNPANTREALREAELDEMEGADIIMVKPGIAYLDIVLKLKEHTTLPISAYQVSGEYSMIKAAGEKGWLSEDQVALESLLAFKRAGADIILSYFSKQVARYL